MSTNRAKSSALPDWLPDGWSMKTSRSRKAINDRYFVCPVTRREFSTREEVLHYLNYEVLQNQSLPPWLPTGWIVEINPRKMGTGLCMYKRYLDPSTGLRFYSKPEVLRFLSTGKRHKSFQKRGNLKNDQPEELLLKSQ